MAAQFISGKDAFQQEVISSAQPVMVDFYADWCGPCKLAEPIMEKLSEEYAGKAKIIKIDTDDPENRPIAAELGIMSIPTVMVYAGGQVVGKQIGFIGEDGYRDLLQKGLQSKGEASK